MKIYQYPKNLISKIGIPELYCDGEYKQLTDDQLAGLNYVINRFFELEQIIIQYRYERNMTFKEIAADLGRPIERIQAIHKKLIQRLRKPAWYVYFRDGYQATIIAKQKQEQKQTAMAEKRLHKLEVESNVIFSTINITDMNWPVRITNAFKREGIYTIEDLVRWMLKDPPATKAPKHIFGLGEGSWQIIFEQLETFNIHITPNDRLY